MKNSFNIRRPQALRMWAVNCLAATALMSGLLAPVVVYAQPAKADAPMATHNTPSNGMNHGGEMKEMMKGMSEKMAGMAMTGNQDVDFAQMMRIHHQGAIDMAEMELKSGKDASMRKMAQDVIKAQKKEISLIDRYLAKNGTSAKKS